MDVKGAPAVEAKEALAELCRIYWYPLYAYARRAGNSPEDAEDITQGCLAGLLEREVFKKTDQKKGRLRSFLLVSLKNHMRNEWRKARQQKRGGGTPVLSIDLPQSEARYASNLIDEMSPELAYDRMWVVALLEEVMKELAEECERKGKGDTLARIAPYLNAGADDSCPYAELAAELGLGESGARVTVHRLRKRYRTLLRERIADTLESTDDLAVELDYLMGLFRHP